MKQIRFLIIALLCMVAQGVWAQTEVMTESELNSAITGNKKSSIKLVADISLSSYVEIPGNKNVTLDLNGHTLNRGLTESDADGHVIYVKTDGKLTLKDSGSNGKLTGGYANNGGAICIYGTVTFEGGTITNCMGSSYGGAVYVVSGGTFTMSGGTIDGCTGDDGGAIYNEEGGTVTISGGTIKNCTSENHSGGAINNHGTCEISGGTIENNSAKNNGGGVGNFDSGVLTISGGTIKNNSANKYGDGVYIGSGTLYMEGNPVIADNDDDNLYLNGSSTKISVGDPFKDGASIGVSLSDYNRLFTSGFRLNNEDAEPTDYFFADVDGVDLDYEDGEAKLSGDVAEYVERSWSGGDTDGEVVSEAKICTGYSTLSSDAETISGGWYLLSGTVEVSKRARINGNVRFILKDGCKYTFKKGIYIVKGKTLTIYGQTNDSGQLIVTDGDDQAAIGGQEDAVGGNLVVHGGYVKAHSNDNNYAGIGGGDGSKTGMQSVTIYGGEVDAHGESSAAGIGGGQQNDSGNQPVVKIYGGKVTTDSEDYGAGIGGGEDRGGCEVYIWGGTVKATGGSKAAGIGGGQEGSGNKFVMYGGTVTATGGKDGAGVGGGHKCSGGTIEIYGGSLTAEGKDGAYAIGSGDDASGNSLSLTIGDNVCVKDANGNLVGKDSRTSTIKSATKCYVQTCSHSGASYTKWDNSYHTINCSYCGGGDELHTKGDDGACTKCGAALPEYTFTFYESNDAGNAYQNTGTEYYADAETEFTFPDCSNVPSGMRFAGWKEADEAPEQVTVDSDDGLYQAGDEIYLGIGTEDTDYYACYIKVAFSGSGTEADPYVIATTDDLDELANAVNNKGYDYEGYYLVLSDDIAYDKDTENNYTPVSSSSTAFNGTFDGQGHTISGINLNKKTSYQGIFAYVGSKGTVQNVTLDNSQITTNSQTGGIVGQNSGTVKNCHVTDGVTITDYSSSSNYGGIVGLNKGTVTGCTSAATIGDKKYCRKVGGIVGTNEGGTVENCLYLGTSVIGAKNYGSIVGYSDGTLTSNYYAASDDLPAGVGSSSSASDQDGAEAGYTVTSGTDGLTLSYGDATTTYGYSGIKVYDSGLLYGGKLYTGATSSVNFNTETSGDDTTASKVTASAGTLVSNANGSYTLTMDSSDAVITAEVGDISTVTITDGEDNTETLAENNGETVNVDYDRELSAGDDGESTAYTVCLPYDVDLDADDDDDDDEEAAGARTRGAKEGGLHGDVNHDGKVNEEDVNEVANYIMGKPAVSEEDADVNGDQKVDAADIVEVVNATGKAVAKVFLLAAVDHSNKQFIFTDAPSFIPAGMPAVIVVYRGTINLSAKRVKLKAMPDMYGNPVYPTFADYLVHAYNNIGYWTGSFLTLRAFFKALDNTELGSYTPMYQPKDGNLQAFPAYKFTDPFVEVKK